MTDITNPIPQMMTVWSGAIGDPAAAVVNEYSVLSIPAFWSAVRFLSESLASLPKQVYRRIGNARQPADHPQNKLLGRKSNQYSIPFVTFETWHSHAVVHGNGYMFVKRDPNTSAPLGYYNLNPNAVTPFRYGGQQWYLVRGGTGESAKSDNVILPAADVLHLPGLGFDGLSGYPVVWLMYEALELARNSQRFASRYLRKGTQIQGSIEIPGTATKEQIDAIVDRLRRTHSGMDADFSYTVLTGGASLKNATIPPEQSQLLQSRQFAVIDMCRILRVPPHCVYDLGRATWANIESMAIEVVKYSLRPWVEKAEQELSSKLLTQAEQDAGYYVRYSVDSLLRGDTATQTNTTLALLNGGVITANESRARLDLPPLDDPAASKLRIPVNFPVVTTSETPQTTPTPSNADEDENFAAARSMTLESLAPVIADAISRVETKTTKAFSGKQNKPRQELVIWCNVFAEEQARYVADALAPVNSVLSSNLGKALDLDKVGQRYAASIRAKVSGAESKPLAEIIREAIESDTNNIQGEENEEQQ
jgi:HK97 family phage portal protein